MLLSDGTYCGSSSQLRVKLPDSPQFVELYEGKGAEVVLVTAAVVEWESDGGTIGIPVPGSDGKPV